MIPYMGLNFRGLLKTVVSSSDHMIYNGFINFISINDILGPRSAVDVMQTAADTAHESNVGWK